MMGTPPSQMILNLQLRVLRAWRLSRSPSWKARERPPSSDIDMNVRMDVDRRTLAPILASNHSKRWNEPSE